MKGSTRSIKMFAAPCVCTFIAAILSAPSLASPNETSAHGQDPVKRAERVEAAASVSLGKKMWTGYGLPNGKLGCAAALSNVLKLGGVPQAHSAGVAVVRSQILKPAVHSTEVILRNGEGAAIDGSRLSKLARPGDVVVAFMKPPDRDNSGPNAHCGIMGAGANIYTNDWNDGVWKQVNIHQMFDFYPYVRLIRFQN